MFSRPERSLRSGSPALIGALCLIADARPGISYGRASRSTGFVSIRTMVLRATLQGRVTKRHRFLLRLHLRQIDALGAAILEIDDGWMVTSTHSARLAPVAHLSHPLIFRRAFSMR
jgi:hypothetical protein